MTNPRPPQTQTPWPLWLKAQLAARRVGASELAVVLGTDVSVVSRWLSGEATPPADALDDLAAVLGLDPTDVHRRFGTSAGDAPTTTYDPFREVLEVVRAQAHDL